MQQSSTWPAASGAWALAALFIPTALTIWPGQSIARTWHVPADAPTIQAGIDSASAGDDVLVAPGTYAEHDIVIQAGIWVHSEQGPDATTVDASGAGRGFSCLDLEQEVTLEGFRIQNGHPQGMDQEGQSGGGVRCARSRLLVIRDCVITECTADGGAALGGGVYAWDSDAEIVGCTVTLNSANGAGGGIFAAGSVVTVTDCEIRWNQAAYSGGISTTAQDLSIVRCIVSGNGALWGLSGGIWLGALTATVRDCLVTENASQEDGVGSGLWWAGGTGSISGCTVARNSGVIGTDAIAIMEGNVAIERTIVAFNRGAALSCWNAQVRVSCSDLYGNVENTVCGEDLGDNFFADPLFCDMGNGDYSLDARSPCLPGNHPDGVDCGLIGARGQGCGPTPIQETTWGRLKMLYRGR